MKVTIFILIIGIQNICTGQTLIDRALHGTFIQSTLEPNEIAKDLNRHIPTQEISPFLFKSNSSFETDKSIDLNLAASGRKALTNRDINTIFLTIPVSPVKTIRLLLSRVQVIASDAQIKDQTGRIYEMNEMHTFRGIVDGDHGSIASLIVIGEEVHVSISDAEGNYRVNRSMENDDSYKLYIDELPAGGPVICGTTDEMITSVSGITSTTKNTKSAGDIVDIYVECDYQLFLDKGGVGGVTNYIGELFNEVATLYANENIIIGVSDIMVWTSSDPYRSMTLNNVSAILDRFGSLTQNDYDGRLATLIIGRVPGSGGLGGIAWVDVLCNNYNPVFESGPYSLNYGFGRFSINSYPSYSYDVSIIAHELGHNFGSPHTHKCSWGSGNNRAIDNCPGYTEGGCGLVTSPTPPNELGTIMSYCSSIDFTKGFGNEPGALIYDRYANAECLRPNVQPCTHVNRTYSNTVVTNTEVYADNNITLNNSVSVLIGSIVSWQAESQFTVNGTFTVPISAILTISADECE